MIASMLKIDLLLHQSDQMEVLEELRQLGVVHIEMEKTSPSAAIESLEQDTSLLKHAVSILASAEQETNEGKPQKPQEALKTCQEIIEVDNTLQSSLKKLEQIEKDIAKAKFWGLTSKKLLDTLGDRVAILPYQVKNRLFDQYDFSAIPYTIVERNTQDTAFLIVDDGNIKRPPFDPVELPDDGVEELTQKKNKLTEKVTALKARIKPLLAYKDTLQSTLTEKEGLLQNYVAINSSKSFKEGEIIWLQGWLPKTTLQEVSQYLEKQNRTWSYRSPEPGEDIPVKLINDRYSKIFEPITNIFQLPHYFELDLTPFIAVFYPIFFAYCLGDAGYGVILLGLSIYSYFTWFRSSKNLAVLGVILGVLTTFMGIVKSGSIFGMPILDQSHPFLQFFAPFVLIPDDQSFVFNAFNVAIMIGVVQVICGILIAIVKAYQQDGGKAALSPVGKLIIIISALMAFLYHMQGVEALAAVADYVPWLILFGILLFILFNPHHEGIGQKIGHGLLPTFFIFTNMLGDILSYVRLFALGVASSVLGLVVNQIGMQIMSGGLFSLLLGIVFLIFGHSLNMALATLGAFVHPLRLTFVEFYNNAHFEGGGRPFQPLTKN